LNFLKRSKTKASVDLSASLLSETRDYLIFSLLILIIFSISTLLYYLDYREFTKFSTYDGALFVEQQYPKKNYYVLKLKTEKGFSFYSTTKTKIKDLSGYYIDATVIIKKDFSFLDYLSGSYLFIGNISIHNFNKNRRYIIKDYISSLHKDRDIGELFSALFLATPINSQLRGKLSQLGVNHLAVLSGFHVGFLVGILSGLIYFLYFKIHQKFFPYRNIWRDIFIIVSFAVVIYLIFLDSPPSFLRAVSMFIIATILFDRNILQDGFELLSISVAILIAFDPRLLFSIGFFFSVAGVFYILLYLKYFNFGKVLDLILINLWVFLAMLPIVHYIFGEFNTLQLLSPIWTILFAIFYPLAIIVHFTPYPDILDGVILSLFELDKGEVIYIKTPLSFLVVYLLVSIFFGIKRRGLA